MPTFHYKAQYFKALSYNELNEFQDASDAVMAATQKIFYVY